MSRNQEYWLYRMQDLEDSRHREAERVVQDLESILRLSVEDMMTEISALPKSAVESLKVIAASAITDGTLDSVSKIKVLDELFGTNLGLLAEFKE